MGDIGAEVGLKMRSAIKAKLMELDCYVDDELPDYIMVMVANKRTKNQMKEDLTLFLNTKTTSFVDWLHIVLKKLKEVHVTNPEILKRGSKRKNSDSKEAAKKIKKEKKSSKSSKNKTSKGIAGSDQPEEKSLTDDLPITANKLTEVRKIVVLQNNTSSNSTTKSDTINEDMFDIPLLSEVDNLSNEEELKLIEKRINSVKNRLGMQVQSSSESEDEKRSNDEDVYLKADPEEVVSGNIPTSTLVAASSQRKATICEPIASSSTSNMKDSEDKSHTPSPPLKSPNNDSDNTQHKSTMHTRIVFGDEPPKKSLYSRQAAVNDDMHARKRSILDRLGKRSSAYDDVGSRPSKIPSNNDKDKEDGASKRRHKERGYRESEDKKESSRKGSTKTLTADQEKHKEDITLRIGVKSKVSVPELIAKPQVAVQEESDCELEKNVKKKGVASVIKVKPRVLLPAAKQASKSLLLKAVAEAQRSIAQTPAVGSTKRDSVFTKGYKDRVFDQAKARKISIKEKSVLRNMIKAMVNSPLRKVSLEEDELEYVPKPIKEQHSTVNIQYKPSPLKQLSVTSETSSDADLPTTTAAKPVDSNFKQQFIVTLDGVDAQQFSQSKNVDKEELPKRISPIIFNKNPTKNGPTAKDRSKIPDELPIVTVPGLKGRERCKFWPNCKSGDKCEFHHPAVGISTSDGLCKVFPNCKFGDNCLYVHPICKFVNSCTRRDCPYSHKSTASRIAAAPSICKFHPKCNNIHCSFYHPLTKPCKFGKYCKNQPECVFSHTSTTTVPKPASLTWRSKT